MHKTEILRKKHAIGDLVVYLLDEPSPSGRQILIEKTYTDEDVKEQTDAITLSVEDIEEIYKSIEGKLIGKVSGQALSLSHAKDQTYAYMRDNVSVLQKIYNWTIPIRCSIKIKSLIKTAIWLVLCEIKDRQVDE